MYTFFDLPAIRDKKYGRLLYDSGIFNKTFLHLKRCRYLLSCLKLNLKHHSSNLSSKNSNRLLFEIQLLSIIFLFLLM